ncbi:hypothetical protein GALMADRAFT_143396 [Galerina marginata CBS 339.88]|uniref:Uncharacterized protein n=1 Tax=Galerina marginata (strain CBS 339.88) TaxID=685588 RepID=A0A067SWK1_GALM3|nr:hypothetical protein GALMADRAFT_143396 [Galerina marginata CBS 339.88]
MKLLFLFLGLVIKLVRGRSAHTYTGSLLFLPPRNSAQVQVRNDHREHKHKYRAILNGTHATTSSSHFKLALLSFEPGRYHLAYTHPGPNRKSTTSPERGHDSLPSSKPSAFEDLLFDASTDDLVTNTIRVVELHPTESTLLQYSLLNEPYVILFNADGLRSFDDIPQPREICSVSDPTPLSANFYL